MQFRRQITELFPVTKGLTKSAVPNALVMWPETMFGSRTAATHDIQNNRTVWIVSLTNVSGSGLPFK